MPTTRMRITGTRTDEMMADAQRQAEVSQLGKDAIEGHMHHDGMMMP